MKNITKKEVVVDKNLIARCGLYCGACNSYLSSKCQGCTENSKAAWCKVRQCCLENNYLSCSDCNIIELKDCKKFNNFFSKMMGFLLRSDRAACINRIREIGYDGFAIEMAGLQRHSIKK